MPTFNCQSIGPDGLLAEVKITATTSGSALAQLRANGHLPISATEIVARARPKPSFFTFERNRISDKQLLAMTSELSLLLSAGQQLEQGLSLIARASRIRPVREAITAVLGRVRGGVTFADALDEHGGFPPLYVAMVRAGEASGALDRAIARLAGMLDRSVKVRETVISALLYPAVLIAISILSIALLLAFVIPQFAVLFAGSEDRLPLVTQAVLAASAWLREYGYLAVIIALTLALIVPRAKSWLKLDAQWDRLVLRLPLVGPLVAIQQTARMTRTLASLHRSGVPLPAALGLSARVVENRALIAVVDTMRQGVKEGRTLSSALAPDGPIPDLAAHLIRVGEESGRLDEVLLQVADIYDVKFELSVKRLLAILEPACVIVLGIMIGGIIVSILLAVISVNDLAF